MCIIALCVYLLYHQWLERPLSLSTLSDLIKKLPWWTLPTLLLLSIGSWMIESKKWQFLIKDFYKLRFRESVLQNLTAQAASFITPFRAGEFALKSTFFKKELRKKILSRILAGNIAQMVITSTLGICGVVFYIKNQSSDSIFLLIFCSALICVLVFTIYLWISKKWQSDILNTQQWIKILMYSLLRYLIFASNWLIVLVLLDYEASLFIIMRNITIYYLLVSIIPVIQIFDIALKWTVASYIFNGSLYNAESILFATTIIWITNSIFPTVLGCAILPFQKLKIATS
ncbi:lysylphosphatidylglycerol synthase-like protein [Nonlabens dokdonensis]|uniref:Holliday junction resolvase n=3 Tax=Nonlabens dokdonensis TaxID=328515 RepID=L7WAW3_NONDD|nr:holliday junction resolvase [Nonlabens dokdonensis DSW-6]PZX43725.1 lysylphosphatidylglycerol synthase-like protein [Nonlabens dokdonensis]